MPFSTLGLSEPIVRAIAERGYTEPTPIQLQAIPAVLSGCDLMAQAQTGTGKTAGFTLPILQRLSAQAPRKEGAIRALVLAPTRELAAQVEESVRHYGKHVALRSMAMFGGVSINPQIERLQEGVDILVATPGRLLDHVQQGTIDLTGVEILVLDEADRMLDMGFIRDIRKILALLPGQRQNLLFSATFSDEIRALADGLLKSPTTVEVARRNAPAELVEQKVMLAEQPVKRALLTHLIKEKNWFQVLVFTRTKHGANRLAEYLAKREIPALAIHGNKSQNARTRALAEFKANKLQVLVATDIAARGLDISELPHVVNFELPNVPEDYVHRIGRTGRAGSEGEALSLVSRDELPLLRDIEKLIKRELPRVEPEDFDMAAALAAAQAQKSEEGREPRQAREPRPAREPRRDAQQPKRQPRPRPDGPRPEGPRNEAQPAAVRQGEPRRGGPKTKQGPKPAAVQGPGQRRHKDARPQPVIEGILPLEGILPRVDSDIPLQRRGRGGNKPKQPRIVYPRDENGDVNGNVILPEMEAPEIDGNVLPDPRLAAREPNGNRANAERNGGGRGPQGNKPRGKGGAGNEPRRPQQEGQGAPTVKRRGLRGAISRGIDAIRKLTD